MTQSAIYGELWTHVRDYQARGCTANEANDLLHITSIEFQPPSKAHVKRVHRERPTIVVRRPSKAPNQAHREQFNDVRATAMEVVGILRPNYVTIKTRGAGALEPTVPPPAPTPKPRVRIAGLLPAPTHTVRHEVPKLLPLRNHVAVHHSVATFVGPLTRKMQAEYAFTVATYGEVIYL